MQITTSRLFIRSLELDDAAFMLELLNSKGFIDNIGDRGIKTIEQSKALIEDKYRDGYPTHGLFVVERLADNAVLGTVSLLKRDNLPFDDIGYAFLPQYFRQGYATEAVTAVINQIKQQGATALHGVVDFPNHISQHLLLKLGFEEDGTIVLTGETQPIKKFTKYL